MKIKALKAAFPPTIPVMLGYLFLGMAFGILLSAGGYSFWWAAIMSVFVYAGSMQFVAIGLMASPFDLAGAAILTLMVNARHLFYGLALLDRFKAMPKQRPYLIFSLTDETFSLHCSAVPPEGVDPGWFHFFIALLDQSYWVAGSTAGALVGSLLTFNTAGIDFAMTALFLVIFVDQWKAVRDHLPALAGLLATALCLAVFGPEQFLIPAMAAIFLALAALRRVIERRRQL